jgi:deoxynucleoside triphosphate triphosphohydrolase SAMHD1
LGKVYKLKTNLYKTPTLKNMKKNMKKTRVYDPIHGFIEITPLMNQIINTEEFQRLRDLKQLGVTTFVFPSANHTRFEHSIGVSHLAGKMIESIRKNNPELEVTERQIELTRIAGLIHDIGHGPYSHLYDDYIKPKKNHEDRGCKIFKDIIKKYNLPISKKETIEILTMINPKDTKKIKKTKIWKYQIVANKINQLDVDKMDYIRRDCFYLGMNFSGEYSRLINDVKVVTIGNTKQIAWSIKLQYDIFHLFSTRYRLHKTVYNHPKVKAFEYLVVGILKKLQLKMDLLTTTDSIIYCDMVKEDRQKIYNRLHPKFIKEFLFTNPKTLKKKEKIVNELKKIKNPDLYFQELEIGFASSETKNPLRNVYYYKDMELYGSKIKPEMYSFIIPSNFNEQIIRIYSLSGRTDILKTDIIKNDILKIDTIFQQ